MKRVPIIDEQDDVTYEEGIAARAASPGPFADNNERAAKAFADFALSTQVMLANNAVSHIVRGLYNGMSNIGMTGPRVVANVVDELASLLEADGLSVPSVFQAAFANVGASFPMPDDLAAWFAPSPRKSARRTPAARKGWRVTEGIAAKAVAALTSGRAANDNASAPAPAPKKTRAGKKAPAKKNAAPRAPKARQKAPAKKAVRAAPAKKSSAKKSARRPAKKSRR